MQEQVKEILKQKELRYITKEFFIKKTSKEMYDKLVLETSFLKNDCNFSERLFCYSNSIVEQPCCIHCGGEINKPVSTFKDLTKEEYQNRFCSKKCFIAFSYDMKKAPSSTSLPDSFDEKINTLRISVLVKTPYLMDWCKIIANKKGVDYTEMRPDELVYFVKNKLESLPKCYCGNHVKYKNAGNYFKHCCPSCNLKSLETKEKRVKTLLDKYGTTNVSLSPAVIEKIKQTNLRKYGAENYFNSEEYKQRITSGDIKKPVIDYVKIQKNNKEKFYKSLFEKRLEGKFLPLFSLEEYTGIGVKRYPFKCTSCGTDTFARIDDGSLPRCPICEPFIDSGGQSKIELEVETYIRGIYKEVISCRNRDLISPYEIDIFLPNKKLAFEVNGLYWHSENSGKGRLYHLYKTKLCAEKGVRLIQIYEDEWNNKKNIVKNKIRSLFGLVNSKIFARECSIKEITEKEKNKFLNQNHVQGEDRSAIKLGMFKGEHLVAVMTFSKLRKALGGEHKENHWELSRYSGLRRVSIVGGAGKILKYFEKNYKCEYIKTYADKRWSVGDLYVKLGFNLERESFPSYWYMDNTYKTRHHRFKFRKNTLKDTLPIYNDAESEWENMKKNGYDRIWDCGHYVYTKTYVK